MINIYLVTRLVQTHCDVYNGIVCKATCIANAKRIATENYYMPIDGISVELVGIGKGDKESVVLTDFNSC